MTCRLCLKKTADTLTIFAFNTELNWQQAIKKYLNVQIEVNDFSTVICKNCAKQLKEFHRFYEHVKKCQIKMFKKYKAVDSQNQDEHFVEMPFFENDSNEDIYDVLNEKCLTNYLPKNEIINEEEVCLDNPVSSAVTYKAENDLETTKHNVIEENCKCILCKKVLKNVDTLLKHMYRQHKGIKPFACNICDLKFTIKRTLQRHIERSHTKKIKNDIDTKENNDLEMENRTCIICNKILKNVDTLLAHMYSIHKDIKPYECETCKMKFTLKRGLRRHHIIKPNCATIKNDIVEQNEAEVNRKNDAVERTCVLCKKVFKNVKILAAHMRKFHKKKELKFSIKNTLEKHLTEKAKGKRKSKKAAKLKANIELDNRTCILCDNKIFKNVDTLLAHMYMYHKGIKPFACKPCKLEFRLKRALRRHFQNNKSCEEFYKNDTEAVNVSLEKYFTELDTDITIRTCAVCKRIFKNFPALKAHMYRSHRNKDPFVCTACGKKFKFIQTFNKHLLQCDQQDIDKDKEIEEMDFQDFLSEDHNTTEITIERVEVII